MRVSALPDLSPRATLASGAVVLVLMVAAVTGLLTVGGSATGASGASVPGYPLTSRGLVLQRVTDAGFDTAVRDARDPRTLWIVVPHDTAATACNLIEPVVTVVSQTASAVRMRVAGYEYLPPPDKAGYSGFTCYLGRRAGLPVRLAAPLGARRVVSAAPLAGGGGTAAEVVDPTDLPRATYLPSGYRATSVQPVDAAHGRVVGERRYAKGAAALVVSSGPAGDVDPTGSAQATRVAVGSDPARLVDDGDTRCVIWAVAGHNHLSVCSTAATPLPAAELLRVARSLR